MPQRPELYPDLADVYQGFFVIGAGRAFNESGPQPVPLSEIVAYMDEIGLRDPEERRVFRHYVRALDGVYLRITHDRIARERERRLKETKSSGKVPRGRR